MNIPEPREPDENEEGAQAPEPTPPAETSAPQAARQPHGSGEGRRRAEDNTDPWWRDGAMRAVEHLANTGRVFTAYDLVDELGVPEPDHPNRWGPLMLLAAKAGVIAHVGAEASRRPTRSGSLCRTWRGTRDFREHGRSGPIGGGDS